MEKIHILTDSSSDIPHDLVEAHGIEIVPIDHFDLNDEGQYEKIVKIDENLYESAGPVLSEDKISKLNGN